MLRQLAVEFAALATAPLTETMTMATRRGQQQMISPRPTGLGTLMCTPHPPQQRADHRLLRCSLLAAAKVPRRGGPRRAAATAELTWRMS